ncbi:hypothetical protein [Acinetobacter gyllenbergii]|uniref:hypothetical protein n=1 Tax=Acinetobacter gyllenbergii TaxID=134534 RepID=UPI000806D2B4|nr:hypothetical protein [Acinetobacter gyllenbergii]OBY73993.1 hypothetical protein NG55_12500 [Acinetobacter gyllenbergii]
MLTKYFSKSYILLLIFLAACNSSANQDIKNKVFELDLTDEQISAEGGGIELYKGKNSCHLILNLYGESGQEKYDFRFKKKTLIETYYLTYRYKNGVLGADDDLKELMAVDSTHSDGSDMELIGHELVAGEKDKNLVKKFEIYKKRVPTMILRKNCD